MSGDLLSTLLSFQPDSPELEKRRDYDSKARNFVSQLNNISSSHWAKGADTQQDVLTVRCTRSVVWNPTDVIDTQPRRKLNSVRLRSPSLHRRCYRQEADTGDTTAREDTMELSGALLGDSRPCTAALHWERVADAGRMD